jgi:hypothetical protein
MRQIMSLVSVIVSLSLLGCATATTSRPLVTPWESGQGKFIGITMLDSTRYHGTMLGVDSSGALLLSQADSQALMVPADSIAHAEYYTDDLLKTALGYTAVVIGLNILIWMASPSRW